MNTYEIIKDLAKEKGLSIRQLEINFGYSNGYIGSWKRQTPNSTELARLADYFNVSVDYLLGRTDNPNPIIKNKKNETYLRAEKDGLDEKEYSDFIEDVEMYMEMRRRMLLEKKKK